MSCRHVRDWLHRDAAELDEAQRLILDDHLAGCERCHADRARLRQVHAIGTGLSARVEQRDLNRAIARALMEGAPRREPAPARSRRTWALAFAGVAIAAAASAAVAVRMRGAGDESSEVAPPPPKDPVPAPAKREAPIPAPSPRTPEPDPGALQTGADEIAAGAIAAVVIDKPRATTPPRSGPTLAELLRLAESAQARGQLELAIERYGEIASRFRTAPEAESALYAAARLELRLGHGARARARLDEYLLSYPRGRYVDDVRRELSLIR